MTTIDLRPADVDVDYYRNDGRTITLDFGDIDITDRTFTAQIRSSVRDTTALGQLDTAFDGTTKVVLTPDADVRSLAEGAYRWDVQYVIDDAPPVTLCAGKWRVRGDATR